VAFTWSEDIAVAVTIIKVSQYIEVQDNVDSIKDNLANVTYLSGVLNSKNDSYLNSRDTTYLNNNNGTYNNDVNSSALSSKNITVNSTKYISYDYNDHGSYG